MSQVVQVYTSDDTVYVMDDGGHVHAYEVQHDGTLEKIPAWEAVSDE